MACCRDPLQNPSAPSLYPSFLRNPCSSPPFGRWCPPCIPKRFLGRLTGLGEEVVSGPLVDRCGSRLLLVDLHAAHRILCHATIPPKVPCVQHAEGTLAFSQHIGRRPRRILPGPHAPRAAPASRT